METITSKTVFIEYSSARKGQHFMTVVQTINHERVIIGRIFREYNPEIKRSYYQAYDFAGNQVFVNCFDISELKNKFKKSGKSLAEMSLATRKMALQKMAIQKREKFPYSQNALRTHDIKAIREKKFDRGKGITKTPEKQNPSEKTKLIKMEKEQDDCEGIYFLAASTDGSDGPTDAAGAFASLELIQKANELKLDPVSFLRNNDSYHFFEKVGGLFKTGPTKTNVCDIQILIIR